MNMSEELLIGKFEWFTDKPDEVGNYIVSEEYKGMTLGWWNGEEWIEMWGSKPLKVLGWTFTDSTYKEKMYQRNLKILNESQKKNIT